MSTVAIFEFLPFAEALETAGISLPAPQCEFVLVPGGEFTMGATDADVSWLIEQGADPAEFRSELPSRPITIEPFLMARTEMCQAVWRSLTNRAAPAADEASGIGDTHAVFAMTWASARNCCTGVQLRLPSEAEWEYSCRAGTTAPWSFGAGDNGLEGNSGLDACGIYYINSGHSVLPSESPYDLNRVFGEWGCRSQATGTLTPNAFGLLDVHGNVWEWVEDSELPYDRGQRTGRPQVDASKPNRVVRGGSWRNNAMWCRSSFRFGAAADARWAFVGFRPACDLPLR